MPKAYHEWYTQNCDHPELNDESVLEYLDGVLTVWCNSDHKSYRVTGPAPTVEDLQKVEDAFDDEPVCADDPDYVLKTLGLELVEACDLPETSGLRPPQL